METSQNKSPSEGTDFKELRLLEELEETPQITQRKMADRLGIALGVANLLTKNLIKKGYVRADEYDSEQYPVVLDGKYAGVIGVGGLLLARIPEELAQSRMDYQHKQTEGQDESVETDLLRDQDKRMPIKIDRNSKHTFGGTKK